MQRIATGAVLSVILVASAAAEVALSGDFKAAKACPAVQSIRTGANPGDVTLTPGQDYPLLAKNKPEATHYQIAVEGASPRVRWVEVGCGEASGASAAPTPSPTSAGGAATHVLSISWEPAFCEEHGDKAECQRETEQSFEASHFSLHGLWPQPRSKAYCGVDRTLKDADLHNHWGDLPEPDLSAATAARLGVVMPGMASGLERHEWIKHGTCFGGEADAYFNRAAELAEQVNASAAQALFAGRIGKLVTADEIRAAFDQSFGAGAGARVEVHCQGAGDGREIGEMILSLSGDVRGTAALGDLMRAAPPVDADCPSGLVAETPR